MTDWDQLSEAEQNAANDEAYAQACEYLRDAGGDRDAAIAALARSQEALRDDIARGAKARATRLDRDIAASAPAQLRALSLVEGFIWDAEI